MRDIFRRDGVIGQEDEIVREARFRRAAEIEHDFDHGLELREPDERLTDREREDIEELGQFPVVGDCLGVNGQCTSSI